MLQEQSSKSKERIRMEERLEKDRQRLQEQIRRESRRQKEREKKLKALIGGLFIRHLPDYLLYEEAEMERIVEAAMQSEDAQAVIAQIKAEAEGQKEKTAPTKATVKGSATEDNDEAGGEESEEEQDDEENNEESDGE